MVVKVDDSKWSYLLGRLREQSNKLRESFIINFIVMNLLSDGYTDVRPVFQQPISEVDDKRELIDLYFPQLKLGIEIDEDQHQRKDNRISDSKRYERINKIAGGDYIEKRIDVNKSRNLTDIVWDAKQLVQLIENMTNSQRQKKGYTPWKTMEERISVLEKNPIIKPLKNDYILWKDHGDVIKLFEDNNWIVDGNRRRAIVNIYSDSTKKKIIGQLWFPKMCTDKQAQKLNKKKTGDQKWSNVLKDDEIIESCLNGNFSSDITTCKYPRLVFGKVDKKLLNYEGYQYLGKFVLDNIDLKEKVRYYKYTGQEESTIKLSDGIQSLDSSSRSTDEKIK